MSPPAKDDMANSADLADNCLLDELLEEAKKCYKQDVEPCKTRSNRNCSNNPRCLKGLGQRSWLKHNKSSTESDDDTSDFKRDKFCGLRNLGATCYLNTFLQLWYHNSTLRKAFYNWRPNNSEQDVLQNPIMSLQLVFAMMQFSQRATVDPAPFIKCLKLDESQEQDTHEFSNLFISFIQNKLFAESDKSILNTISRQYSMNIAYVIKCSHCNNVSERESDFFELLLRVKGFKTIEECIEDYLKEENLEGTNQYACQVCNCLQDAQRFIELRRLPPVLNLQLLRFDSEKGRSKKINSFVKFPTKLDMNKFLKQDYQTDGSKAIYQLFAVLIHEGQTAHSGHYITFIKRENAWYKFNDEHVEQLKDFNLKVDSDDDFVESDKNSLGQAAEKTERDVHKSKNAYMLVYRCESEVDVELPSSYSECNLPTYLTDVIENDNCAFAAEQEDLALQKALQRESERLHQTKVKEICEKIDVPLEADSYEVISKAWLVKFFEAKVKEDVPPVDNEPLLCTHQKLDMNSSYKCISNESANLIYSTYGGGPRIPIEAYYCRDCVLYKVKLADIKHQIDIDAKNITHYSKFKADKQYWVGKESFKKWKNLRLALFEKQFSTSSNGEEANGTNGDDDNDAKFNHDILCEHGNLISDESKMRPINENVWEILFSHFPDAPIYEKDSAKCPDCLEIDRNNQLIRDNNSTIAIKQRASFASLIFTQIPLFWSDLSLGGMYFIVSTDFYKLWRKFVINPSHWQMPNTISNQSILCESHQLFLFPPANDLYVGFDKNYIIITEEDWINLKSFYDCPQIQEIVILKTENQYELNPPSCESCFTEYVDQEKRKRFVYTNATIYVHKVVCDEDSTNNSDSEATKRMRVGEGNGYGAHYTQTNANNHDGLRRSSRRRRCKNELEVKVSSFDKLKDIKFKIMEHFKVPTYDQTLFVNDKVLNSHQNSYTLAELEIEPDTIFVLRVDDKTDENGSMDSSQFDSNIATEGGFKGTQLHLL